MFHKEKKSVPIFKVRTFYLHKLPFFLLFQVKNGFAMVLLSDKIEQNFELLPNRSLEGTLRQYFTKISDTFMQN